MIELRGYVYLGVNEVADVSFPGLISIPACIETTTASTQRFNIGVGGIRAHPAWDIAWVASETPIMSPKPPIIKCQEVLSTWIPGAQVTENANFPQCKDPNHHTSDGSNLTGALLVAIVVPSVVGLLLCGCFGLCTYKWRKAKRSRRAAELGITQTNS